MPISAKTFRTAIAGLFALLPVGVHAEGIDTEHIFGFMIGSDVGTVGEREFQSQTTGSFGKTGGRYRAVGQELELEFLPAKNFRIEMGTTFAAHDINGVLGFDDRRQLSWQGVSVDFRYRFLDKDAAPFGEELNEPIEVSAPWCPVEFTTQLGIPLRNRVVSVFDYALRLIHPRQDDRPTRRRTSMHTPDARLRLS